MYQNLLPWTLAGMEPYIQSMHGYYLTYHWNSGVSSGTAEQFIAITPIWHSHFIWSLGLMASNRATYGQQARSGQQSYDPESILRMASRSPPSPWCNLHFTISQTIPDASPASCDPCRRLLYFSHTAASAHRHCQIIHLSSCTSAVTMNKDCTGRARKQSSSWTMNGVVAHGDEQVTSISKRLPTSGLDNQTEIESRLLNCNRMSPLNSSVIRQHRIKQGLLPNLRWWAETELTWLLPLLSSARFCHTSPVLIHKDNPSLPSLVQLTFNMQAVHLFSS